MYRQKQTPEGVLQKKVFLEILKNWYESDCARVSFLNKVAGLTLQFY